MDGRSLEVDFGDQKDRFVVSDCFIHLYKPRVYSSPDRIIDLLILSGACCIAYTGPQKAAGYISANTL